MTPVRSALFSLEQIGIRLGLDQIRALVEALGRPDRAFRSIVVAGTNGKGSVSAMVAHALRAAGHRVGHYTSPHLVEVEERFAIDGHPVAAEAFDHAAARVLAAGRRLPAPPTFFEATTAIAFELFREAGVEIAVLEVGLGGRLDATNVVDPIAVAITAIDFDHEAFLGDTIEAIAGEKAGVIKPGAIAVLGVNPPGAEAVVAETAARAGARLVRANADVRVSAAVNGGLTTIDVETPRAKYAAMRLALRGRHQIENAVTAVRLLEEIDAAGLVAVPAAAIRAGLEHVVWPARLELVTWHHRARIVQVLIDGAHNPAGARTLAEYVRETYGRRLPMVLAIMRDKRIDQVIAALAPAASAFMFTAPATAGPRAADPAELAVVASRVARDVPATTAGDPLDALAEAAALETPVVVAGSLYLAGEIRSRIT